ncbi:hypothetical protein A4A49_29940 [Nicotiana attenuata]|uniref:Uncharacterized protein n=1 Tax=Nicotiana attenuata TaxID=49451 RepID=A0A1J6KA67_NICAT|nr:hypothetical protein A4A49_29940 [Nicotiana attenuata]
MYNPQVLYSRKLVHTIKGFNSDQLSYNYLENEFTSKLGFTEVQQVIVNGPSGRYYEIESDQGVRSLLSLVSDQFNVIDFFVVDECELSINVHNIVQHIESNIIEFDVATDCSSDDSEEHGCHSSNSSDNSDSESDSLERLHTQKERKISDKLTDYKELHKSMTFKDIPEARKFINMYSLSNVDNNLTESFNSWIKEARFNPIIKMLENIRVKVMNMLREHESNVLSWSNDFSPQTMQLYSQYLKIANKCHVHSNGQEGKMNPLTEIHWWYSKEAYLLAYSHKLQPVRGEKFWKVEASHAVEPPEFVKMDGRPKVKRTTEKNETVNRKGEWMQSRKGSIMKCSTYRQPGHNARGCTKHSKGKQPMASKKKGNQAKRQRCLTTQDSNDEQPMSPLAANIPAEEDIELSAPLFSQASQSSHPIQDSNFQFMPTPSVQRKPPNNTVPPDFESDSAPEIRSRSFSEERTRLLMRQQGTIPAITRTINFVGDSSGVRKKAITENQLEKMAKLKTRKGNGKSQN